MEKKRYYLSFANNTGFLGAAIVYATDEGDALAETRKYNINPGGQVLFSEIPDEAVVDSSMFNRLLTREDLESAFGPLQTLGELKKDEPGIENYVTFVHEECNKI